MNRKLVVLLVAFLTLAPLAAHNPAGAVQRALQLDETQPQELDELLQLWRAQIAPLRRELRELQGQLRDLSQNPVPDLTAIGATHLRIQAVRAQIREAEENCRLDFEMLLTDEQLRTYARIRRTARQAQRMARIIPAFEELNLL